MIEIGSRTRTLPAPPHVVDDESEPTVLDADKPHRVAWSSLWPTRPRDQVLLELTAAGSQTALRLTLLTPDDPPDSRKTGHLRRRINHLLFADLRFSYGQ